MPKKRLTSGIPIRFWPPGANASTFPRDRIADEHAVSISAASRVADLPAVCAFDATRFGDDRGRWLGMIFERSHVRWLLRRRGEIAGYVLGVPAIASPILGPLVAVDADAARDLLGAALAELPSSHTVTLGIPEANRDGVAMCRALGFEPRPSCTRMVFGADTDPGQVGAIFAIANGAIG